MDTTTFFSGAKTLSQPLSSRYPHLRLSSSVASFSGSCGARRIPIVGSLTRTEPKTRGLEGSNKQLSCVMEFGGSFVASAEGMKGVADLILSFPEATPVIVLSDMGKTTNKLLVAGEKAASCVSVVSEIDELSFVKELHYRTVDELGLDRALVTDHLEKLERLLNCISILKEFTPRARDYLVSFGECMSTRIFAAYLNKIGVKARQYDAFDIGFITTDDFTNADILEATYPAIAKRLNGDWNSDPAIPIVTGFLGKGWGTCAVTTLGRGCSDLTATTVGKALGLREIQVWKDVDGFLTCDPNIYSGVEPVPYLTLDDQVLHSRSMRPAREGDIPVKVKNSYNPNVPGTLITKSRDMSKVFSDFKDLGISEGAVATSESGTPYSFTLDRSKGLGRWLILPLAENWIMLREKSITKVVMNLLKPELIFPLSEIVKRFSPVSAKVLHVLAVLRENEVTVQVIPQGESLVNILVAFDYSKFEKCVKGLPSALQ